MKRLNGSGFYDHHWTTEYHAKHRPERRHLECTACEW